MSSLIQQGDCVEVTRQWNNEGVRIQLCVTSPPYDNLRQYGGYSWSFSDIAQSIYNLLCDGGILCWNIGDAVMKGGETLTSMRQALYFVDSIGFTMHDTMIYEKVNFSAPSRNRYHQTFEYVFVLSKGKPRIFNPIKDRKNIYAGAGTWGKNTKRKVDGQMTESPRNVIAEYGMRTNVWRGNTVGQENPCKALPHPAMMPLWLARDLILSWSDPGDIVLDPFAGSGTTGLAAKETGRKFRLIDTNPEYVALMNDRIYGDMFK